MYYHLISSSTYTVYNDLFRIISQETYRHVVETLEWDTVHPHTVGI